MQCYKCKTELPNGAVYCFACGKKQIPEKRRKPLKRANGTGTIYKLKGRRKRPWVAAKNHVIIGYYETRTDALESLERLSGRSIGEKYNMTFADVYAAWSEEHYKKIGKTARLTYMHSYSLFSSLHDRKFRSLHTSDFQIIIDQLSNLAHGTLLLIKQLVTQMYTWAIREEIVATNYGSFIKAEGAPAKARTIFTADDISRLKNDDGETAKIILMLIYTGMRISELFLLPLENYHGAYVIGGEKTAAGKNRVIPIIKDGQEYFRYFAKCATGKLLLSGYSKNKNAVCFRRKDYYPLLEKLGISRKPPHSTRHTFASIAVKAGTRPEILQAVLGHADYSTTANIYTHIDQNTLITAIESIDVANTLLTNQKSEKNSVPENPHDF